MSYTEYHDTLSKFARLRVRSSTLPAFGFHSEDGFGWLYTVPIDGTPLECHVSISAKGVVSERVLDSDSGDEYTLYRVANANGRFIGLVRKAVTSLLKRLAASCFERNVFIQNQSRELLETVRSQWGEELEFLWEDSPESAVLRRADTGKWYAVMMRLPKRKFGLADDSISEFILLRIPNEKRDTTLADRRFLSAFHMNKRTWFAIQLDGHMKITEILHLVECSRDQAVKK